ncbi:MAG: cytochrome-c peroxidase, partial [Ramlibacter sp.]
MPRGFGPSRAPLRDRPGDVASFARRLLAIGTAAALAQLVSCGGGGGGTAPSVTTSAGSPSTAGAATQQQLSPAAQLGELIFKDGTLSASGRLSCASCHDPQRAHASPFDSPVALGGPNLDRAGLRNPPSLRYLRFNGRFQFGTGGKAAGGFFWDGRASTLHEQAAKPFLNAREMANTSAQSVVDKIAAAPYAAQFRSVFGDTILSQADAAFDRVAFALQQYQLEDPDFAPFSSKFDA